MALAVVKFDHFMVKLRSNMTIKKLTIMANIKTATTLETAEVLSQTTKASEIANTKLASTWESSTPKTLTAVWLTIEPPPLI